MRLKHGKETRCINSAFQSKHNYLRHARRDEQIVPCRSLPGDPSPTSTSHNIDRVSNDTTPTTAEPYYVGIANPFEDKATTFSHKEKYHCSIDDDEFYYKRLFSQSAHPNTGRHGRYRRIAIGKHDSRRYYFPRWGLGRRKDMLLARVCPGADGNTNRARYLAYIFTLEYVSHHRHRHP